MSKLKETKHISRNSGGYPGGCIPSIPTIDIPIYFKPTKNNDGIAQVSYTLLKSRHHTEDNINMKT